MAKKRLDVRSPKLHIANERVIGFRVGTEHSYTGAYDMAAEMRRRVVQHNDIHGSSSNLRREPRSHVDTRIEAIAGCRAGIPTQEDADIDVALLVGSLFGVTPIQVRRDQGRRSTFR